MKKLIIIFLSIVLVLSFKSNGVLATGENVTVVNTDIVANDIKSFLNDATAGDNGKLINYYTTDDDGNKTAEHSFFKLAGDVWSGADVNGHGFSFHDNRINYIYDGKVYTVNIEYKVDGQSVYSGNTYTQADDNKLLNISATASGSTNDNPLDAYVGKESEIIITVYDETGKPLVTSNSAKSITSNDVEQEDITKKESLISKVFGVVFAPVRFALKILEEIVTGLALSLGDQILTQVSNAVGEPLTIDGIIFGDVKKVSIDFWGEDTGYMAGAFKGVISTWYTIFTAIATTVYLAILLVIGIQIVNSSTGRSRAKYKILLMDWAVGIALLFLFPYAMKTMTEANTALVAAVKPKENVASVNAIQKIENETSLYEAFGGNNFPQKVLGKSEIEPSDGMMYIRYLAGKRASLPLTIVYLIMLFQMLVILFTYYKRAFMIAFLIIIFPLVAMTYTLDKLRRWSNEDAGL